MSFEGEIVLAVLHFIGLLTIAFAIYRLSKMESKRLSQFEILQNEIISTSV